MVARRSRTNLDGESVKGQAAKQPDPPSWECNAGNTKIKRIGRIRFAAERIPGVLLWNVTFRNINSLASAV